MKKLLLLLFLFSISSNVFADEFEEFDKISERKFITCWKSGQEFKYSTDGKNLYDEYNEKLINENINIKDNGIIEDVTGHDKITKKPNELKFIIERLRKNKSHGTRIYSRFIDFENANMIWKISREYDEEDEIINYTCISGNH